MSEQSGGKLTCPLCGRAYRWRPDLAGQSVRCQCGQALTMPADPITEPDDEPWMSEEIVESPALVEDNPTTGRACPWCGQTMPEDETVCVDCGYDLTTGKPIDHQLPADAQPQVARQAPAPVLATGSENIPIENGVAGLMLAAGFVAMVVAGTLQASFFGGVLLVVIVIIVTMIVSLPMYLGCVIVGRIMKCDYGGFGAAVPKLMAMWIAPLCIDVYAPTLEQKQVWMFLVLVTSCLLLGKYFFRLNWVQAMVTAVFMVMMPILVLLLIALVVASLVGISALQEYLESVQPNAFDAPAVVEYVTGRPPPTGDMT